MATTYAYDHGYGYGATPPPVGSPGSACTSFVGSAFSQGSCRQQYLAARSQTSASKPSSYGSSQLGTTASRRLARFAHDMPPPDYFSSGASRRNQGCYDQSTDYSYASRAAEQQQQQQPPPRLYHSDSRSLSPADSISNVGSRASSRSGSSKRSRRSSAAGPASDCREGGGGEYPAEADWRAANRGWSAGVKPYYHAANGYWMVDLEPDVGA